MLYIKPKCEDHGYDIGMCCEKCLCLKCPHCKIEVPCEEDAPHVFRTLADTETRIRSEFAALEKKCSEKQTEMCKVEKKTWQEIDKLEEECEEMNRQVDEKSAQLIAKIRVETDKFKRCICEAERLKKLQLEKELQQMREKKEELDGMRTECIKKLRECYVTELVMCKKQEMAELEKSCNKKCFFIQETNSTVSSLKDGIKKFLDFQIKFVPDTLICIAEQGTPSYCYSLNWRDESTLLCCTPHGVYSFSPEMKHDLLYYCNITSLWSDDTAQYMVDVQGPEKNMKRILIGNPCKAGTFAVLGKFPCTDEWASFITGYGHLIVATAQKSLIIYNKKTKDKKTKELWYQPNLPCFNEVGELLVIGDDSALRKYKVDVETGEILNELWKHVGGNISNSGICLMEDGLILVPGSRYHNSYLFIISQDGKLIKTINHRSLSGTIGGVSIKGTTLAVPYWSMNKFMLYSLL